MEIVSSFGLGKQILDKNKKFNCLLGISVGSRSFSKEHIKKYILFCLKHFEKILIIIVDEIKKHNWMAFDNLSEEESLKKALFEGKEMHRAVTKIIKTLEQEKYDTSRIKLVQWNEIESVIPEYQKTTEFLKKHLERNPKFKSDALKMTEKYADARAIKNITLEQKETAMHFLIKEIALFLLIGKSTKENYCIDVYPGKFTVMENIFNEKYENILEELPKGIKYGHVEIAPKVK